MGFEWIVPYNSTQADTTNPIFFLGMWGFLAMAFTYIAFARIARSFRSVFGVAKGDVAGYKYIMDWDIGLNAVFGFAWLVILYGYAWGGYIGTILYNYIPNGTPVGQYKLSLTQDIYCLIATSIGTLYLLSQFAYKYYLYSRIWKPTKVDPDSDDSKGKKPIFDHDNLYENVLEDVLGQRFDNTTVEDVTAKVNSMYFVEKLNKIGYFFRFYVLSMCVLAWVILPGAWGYTTNRDLISGGAWLVLVECIVLSAIVAAVYFSAVTTGIEAYWFPSINVLTYSDYYSEAHATKGYLVGQRMPMAVIVAFMFYVYSAEIMIFGDQMKPLASFFVCMLLPLLMAGAAKDLATFLPFHIANKTYYFLILYFVQSIRTPLQDSDVIDKVIIDYNAGCTGPEYRFMNEYNTTFVVTAAVGFGIAVLYSLVAGLFYHAKIRDALLFVKRGMRDVTSGDVKSVDT